MRTRGTTHLARSFVTILGAVLVLAGAGIAAARTMTGPPWQEPLLSPTPTPSCDTGSTDCTTTGTTDPAQQATDAQAFFDAFTNQCGGSLLGNTNLTDTTTDPQTVQAFSSLAGALAAGQIDHMVQSVRVLLDNCQANANDGLRNALYHHGLNWERHYQHELWLEQKFADRWVDGKPGNGHDSTSVHGNPHTTDGGDAGTKVHGNPHASDPTWSPGNGNGHSG